MTVLDTLGMFDAAYALPEQVETAAAALASGVDGLPAADEISNVLVLGMGGSGISGDVLSAVAGPVCSVPILVSKEYELPGFVDSGTLVFAVSFSGNTEETIESATEAAHAGAKVVTVSAGGRLAELGVTWGAPHVSLPGDIVMPRAAIGAASVPLLVMLGQIGLCGGVEADIDATVKQLRHRRDELSKPRNSAEELARHIGRTFPIVYGGGPIGAVAAQRWKGEFNENAKAPAFSNRVPEACHNEAAGWGQHGDVTRQVLHADLPPSRSRAPSGGAPLRPPARADARSRRIHTRRRRPRRRAHGAAVRLGARRRLGVTSPRRSTRGRPRPDPCARVHQGRAPLEPQLQFGVRGLM